MSSSRRWTTAISKDASTRSSSPSSLTRPTTARLTRRSSMQPARCRARAPYVGRYIVERIAAISGNDIKESLDEGYPTVLVVGPNPFLDAAFSVIREAFPKAVRRKSQKLEIDPLDGYRYLAKDERSRLGWRIILACAAF